MLEWVIDIRGILPEIFLEDKSIKITIRISRSLRKSNGGRCLMFTKQLGHVSIRKVHLTGGSRAAITIKHQIIDQFIDFFNLPVSFSNIRTLILSPSLANAATWSRFCGGTGNPMEPSSSSRTPLPHKGTSSAEMLARGISDGLITVLMADPSIACV